MDYIKINGVSYDVLIVDVSESFNILYSDNTGRVAGAGARIILDPLGTFYTHKVTFARKKGFEDEYDNLFNELSKPVSDGISVDMVHGQSTIKYDAYVSQGERGLKKIDINTGKVYWDKFTASFIPMEAQVVDE